MHQGAFILSRRSSGPYFALERTQNTSYGLRKAADLYVMFKKIIKKLTSLILVLFCVSCTNVSNRGSLAIANNFELNSRKKIDLAIAIEDQWDKVYIFGPYTTEEKIDNTLGFNWDSYSRSSIGHNEGISLLIFTKNKQIIKYIEHPRNQGDFSNLYRKEGYKRSEATFVLDPERKENWPYLIHKIK